MTDDQQMIEEQSEMVSKVFFDIQLIGDMKLDWDSVAALLQAGTPLCFNMFNDGEMSIIHDGEKAVASRGSQQGSSSLAGALAEALHFRAKNYFAGIPCERCYPGARKEALEICGDDGQSHITLANLLINQNYMKTLTLLRGCLYGQRVVTVVSDRADTTQLDQLGIKVEHCIKVPHINAWGSLDDVTAQLNECIQPFDKVLFLCGPMGRVLAYDRYRLEPTLTCLELGSFFDPWTQNKAYLYHQNLLPNCDVCNNSTNTEEDEPALLQSKSLLDTALANCKEREFYSMQAYDQFFQLYKGDYDKMQRMYQLLMQTFPQDFNIDFYCLWSIARCHRDLGKPKDIVEEAYLDCQKKYSWRAEPAWEYVTTVLTNVQSKRRFELLCLLDGLTLPNPDICIVVDSSLYSWRILDEITHQAYHVGEFDRGFRAMKDLLSAKSYPESEHERIKTNSEFYYRHMSEQSKYIQFKAEIQKLASTLLASAEPKPLFLHFVCLETDSFKFDMISYIAIRAAYELNSPDRVIVYTDVESSSPWWHKMKLISDRIIIARVTKPTWINNHVIWAPQHQCDVMRINILNEIGGVYFDLDALSIKPVRDLVSRFERKVVMAKETDKGLCNCVILAPPKSQFLTNWIKTYETSYGNVEDHWVGLSVRKPLELAALFSDEVVQMPMETFIPHLYCDYSLFEDGKDCTPALQNSYVCHLYTTELYKNPTLVPTGSDYMHHHNNTFTHLFKKYVEDV